MMTRDARHSLQKFRRRRIMTLENSLQLRISPFDQPALVNENNSANRRPLLISNISDYIKDHLTLLGREEEVIICAGNTDNYHELLKNGDKTIKTLVLCANKRRVKYLWKKHRASTRNNDFDSSRIKYCGDRANVLSHSECPRLVTTLDLLSDFKGANAGEKAIYSLRYDVTIIDCGLRTLFHHMYKLTPTIYVQEPKRFVNVLRLLLFQCRTVIFTNDMFAPALFHVATLNRFVNFNRVVHFAAPFSVVDNKPYDVAVTVCHSNVSTIFDNVVKDVLPCVRNEESSENMYNKISKNVDYKARVISGFVKRNETNSELIEGDFTCKLLNTINTQTGETLVVCSSVAQAKQIYNLVDALVKSKEGINVKKMFDCDKTELRGRLIHVQTEEEEENPYARLLARETTSTVTVTTLFDYSKDVIAESVNFVFIHVDDRCLRHSSLFQLLHLARNLSNANVCLFVQHYSDSWLKTVKNRDDDMVMNGPRVEATDILKLNDVEKRLLVSKERLYERMFVVGVNAKNVKYYSAEAHKNEHFRAELTAYLRYHVTKNKTLKNLFPNARKCYKITKDVFRHLVNNASFSPVLRAINKVVVLFKKPDENLLRFLETLDSSKMILNRPESCRHIDRKYVVRNAFRVIINPSSKEWKTVSSYDSFEKHCDDLNLWIRVGCADTVLLDRLVDKIPVENRTKDATKGCCLIKYYRCNSIERRMRQADFKYIYQALYFLFNE